MVKIINRQKVSFLASLTVGALLILPSFSASAQQPEPFRAKIPATRPGQPKAALGISLKGGWLFATDPGERGIADRWYAAEFDDSKWQTLLTGKTWKEQGITHSGWGWYRQRIFIPKEYTGIPLVLQLMANPSDDEVWFNGKRVGGWSGEYKYENLLARTYTVAPADIRYGELNTIAIRVWGGNITFIGDRSLGLVTGAYVATLDPYGVGMREPGGPEEAAQLFDLSDAQRGKPFEIIFHFPGNSASGMLSCTLKDFSGKVIAELKAPVTQGEDGITRAVVPIDPALAQTIYLRGRFKADLVVTGADGKKVYSGSRSLDGLSFARRDDSPLPPLEEKSEATPYGNLKLVDEIDCSTALPDETHPYMQGALDKNLLRVSPGLSVGVHVAEVLGKKARESENGWFAYRIGRGKLKPHATYLLRIEYPEDKPRYCPVEIQVGQNYMDVGWQNGVGPDDPYDPWPLGHAWQWYDTIVPLDDETVGAGGTGTARAENGFWVYFLNKITPGKYFSLFEGGPAIARMKLYEIDPEKNAPRINLPKDLPRRVLMFDWERQADHDPADLVRYAKLMGYSAISPIILKWAFANYAEPMNGYETINVDDRNYWAHKDYVPGSNAEPPVPGKESQHLRYLAATKRYGVNYIPRFEYGGSMDLPEEARAIDATGKPAKPNRFGPWCGDLLHPATWDDLARLMDGLIKPYAKDNPQLTASCGASARTACRSATPRSISLYSPRRRARPSPRARARPGRLGR